MQPFTEHIVPSPDSSFTCRKFELPAFPFRWHHHPEVELTLITRGRGQRFVGDSIEPFAEGDLVLLGSDVPHTWHSPPGRGRRVGSVVIQFRRDFIGPRFFDLPEAAKVRRLLHRASSGLAFSGNAAARVARRMAAMSERDGFTRLTDLLASLHELAQHRGARPLSSAGFRPRPNVGDAGRIDRVWRLARNLEEAVTQRDAAAALGMTPAGFSRYFKRTTGHTFVAYVHELRVAEACRLLIDTDTPVTDICFASGFGNLSNFNRVFRRLKRVSPRQFRQQHRDAAAQ